ncbi:MAG TPA: type II secretion system protein GspM [Arenimonas sp.]|nr:type II secretion system protein GspM [Arenimonas sp.]
MRSPERNHAQTLLGLLLAALAAYGLLLHWWWTAPMLDMGEEITSLQREALELRMESAQREQLRAELSRLSELAQTQGGFLSEANKELASAALVQRLESVVTASVTGQRCKVTARTPIESTAKEPFTRVAIQVRLQCGMSELAAVLHALEGGSPQLFIDNLDVLSRRAYLGAGEAASGALDVSFDLYGYLHGNRRSGDDD